MGARGNRCGGPPPADAEMMAPLSRRPAVAASDGSGLNRPVPR